jgi:carbon monoxide dehydrogenase subunit G
MQLEHEFVVPVPVDQAWDVLLDVERIAPCMPGATVESFDGETVQGRVKVKVGPIQVTYSGTARFVEKDAAAHRVKLDASGKEARGSGTAKATVDAVLVAQGDSTKVNVSTDLAITGKPAQFGRGVMVEVGNKLIGRFADCLAEEIRKGDGPSEADADAEAATASGPGEAAAAAGPATTPPKSIMQEGTGGAGASSAAAATPSAPPRAVRRPEDDAIDLLDVGGVAVAKRLAPVAAGLLVLFILWRALRRS